MRFPQRPLDLRDRFGLIGLGVRVRVCEAREQSQITQECIRGPGF